MTAPEHTRTERAVVLLVEDDAAHAELAIRSLDGPTRPRLVAVETLQAARDWLSTNHADLVLADLRLPDGSGLDLLEDAVPLVVLTSQGDEGRAVAAMKGGALDYVVKSAEMYDNLAVIVQRSLRSAQRERDRAQAMVRLEASEARFRQLVQSIQEAFWLLDTSTGTLAYASPAWERVYGRPVPAGGEPAAVRLARVHPDDREAVAALGTRIAAGPTEIEFRLVDSGRVSWVHERTFPIVGDDGRVRRIAGLGADVTRRHELEQAIRQGQKMEAIGQLAGGIAHDFNNMLTAMMSAGEELQAAPPAPVVRELARLIVSASEQAATLTGKLLTFARKGPVRRDPVDVHQVIRDALVLLSRSVDRQVTLSTELSAASSQVLGDPALLQNAILNLGINARDAMPEGGLLQISTSNRVLDAMACETLAFDVEPGLYVVVTVRDSGCGIPGEAIGRVFEPFFSLKSLGRGTGLGLAAVYGTVVEHRGAVGISSVVDVGTAFEILLPVAPTLSVSVAETVERAAGSGTLLLIDDEPLVLEVAQKLLASCGYDVLTARDGVEGVAVFEARHGELVAVVCDQVMPALSGTQAAVRMREIDPSVPIVLCTGFLGDARSGLDASATSAAVDAIVAKPYRRHDLMAALHRVVRGTGTAGGRT